MKIKFRYKTAKKPAIDVDYYERIIMNDYVSWQLPLYRDIASILVDCRSSRAVYQWKIAVFPGILPDIVYQ